MTYDNNDGPIYSVLAGKPGTCCVTCTTIDSYHDGTGTCPAGFNSVMIFEGYYRCERIVRTSIGCMDNPGPTFSACTASGSPSQSTSYSYSGSPCP